jgi:pimeloyl-ACP methyl ester carboxylesterase
MDADLAAWREDGAHFDYLGHEVFHRVGGSGEPLLLIHGYPFGSWDWHRVWDRLTERFRVIAPDMLGLGFSAKPTRYRYTVARHADMHEALLAHLGIGACHVLAHDLGDSVAQELLARQESKLAPVGKVAIRSLALLNGGLFHEAYQPRLIQRLLSTTPLGTLASRAPRLLLGDRVLERTLAELFGPDTAPTPRELRQFVELLDWNDGRRVTHQVGRFILDRELQRDRWVDAMRRTPIPMRLIDGPADPNSGRHMAERYAELVPHADVVMLDDRIGHWPQLEDPQGVLAALEEFWERAVGYPRA